GDAVARERDIHLDVVVRVRECGRHGRERVLRPFGGTAAVRGDEGALPRAPGFAEQLAGGDTGGRGSEEGDHHAHRREHAHDRERRHPAGRRRSDLVGHRACPPYSASSMTWRPLYTFRYLFVTS